MIENKYNIIIKKFLKVSAAFFHLTLNPSNTQLIFSLQHEFHSATSLSDREKILSYYKTTPAITEMLDAHYLPEPYTLIDLMNYPEETFGSAYFKYLTKNRFSSNFFPAFPPQDHLEYFEVRMNQTHDLLHVLTGFGVSLEDEVGIQAFYIGQAKDIFSFLLVLAMFLHALVFHPRLLRVMFKRYKQGFIMGKKALPFYSVQWETLWHVPLIQLRKSYNIEVASVK